MELGRIDVLDVQQNHIRRIDNAFRIFVEIRSAGIDGASYTFRFKRFYGFDQKLSLYEGFPSGKGHAAVFSIIWDSPFCAVNDFIDIDFSPAAEIPRIRIVTISAPSRTTLHKEHRSYTRSVDGPESLYRMQSAFQHFYHLLIYGIKQYAVSQHPRRRQSFLTAAASEDISSVFLQ